MNLYELYVFWFRRVFLCRKRIFVTEKCGIKVSPDLGRACLPINSENIVYTKLAKMCCNVWYSRKFRKTLKLSFDQRYSITKKVKCDVFINWEGEIHLKSQYSDVIYNYVGLHFHSKHAGHYVGCAWVETCIHMHTLG